MTATADYGDRDYGDSGITVTVHYFDASHTGGDLLLQHPRQPDWHSGRLGDLELWPYGGDPASAGAGCGSG
jgi:hypothetical protein